MPNLICNTCNAEFSDENAQKSHYRTDWHQYNLKRKVAGAPSVSEALFISRLEALAAERGSLGAENLLYTCSLCCKEYRSSKAHAQHLRSKIHLQRASLRSNYSSCPITVTRPVPHRLAVNQPEKGPTNAACGAYQLSVTGDSSDEWEWEEVNDDDDVLSLDSDELDGINQGQGARKFNIHEDLNDWNATRCFFCDLFPDGTIGGCLEHMHKQHGFFLPYAEYLRDPQGLLSYLGMKVVKDFTCLYCEGEGKQFSSLEAVRKHMISKSHCKLRYGGEDLEDELAKFYDFTSSYLPEEDALLVSEEELTATLVSLSAGGGELIVVHDSERKQGVKTIGSREFLRYYKQKPRPSDADDDTLVVSRYRGRGLATKQSQDGFSNHKETKKAPYCQAEAMRTKLGIKNNVLKNLPKNVVY